MVAIFWAVGLVMVAFALPLIRGKVRPNGLYGLRVGETMDDERVWYEANARSARDLLRLGTAIVLGSTLIFALPWADDELPASICCALTVVGVVVYAGRGLRIAREVEREFRDADQSGRGRQHGA